MRVFDYFYVLERIRESIEKLKKKGFRGPFFILIAFSASFTQHVEDWVDFCKIVGESELNIRVLSLSTNRV